MSIELSEPMRNEFLLSDAKNGDSVVIESVEDSSFKIKLVEMGLVEGKVLQVLFRAPLGDPIAIDVDGYTLSLRKDEAKWITVYENPNIV